MTAYRPRLRAHLVVEGAWLRDRLLDRSYPLDVAGAAVAPLLDGTRAWSELRTELAALGHDGADADAALRRLLLLHAVEGAGDAVVATLERVIRREEAVPTSILDGARFACQGSGACCQGYRFGPLTDADVAALDALDLATAFPQLKPPYVETHEGGRFLRRDAGDRCVFLAEDRRCGLHAKFGADAKPSFCRRFPLDAFGTVMGIRIVDRGTCATFGTSARTGLPLVDDLERVRALLPPPVLHHPVANVDGWDWDYGTYLRFTTAATTLVRRNLGTASETLLAIGRCLDALVLATATCPLEPEQPDARVSAVLGVDGASWYRPSREKHVVAGTRELIALLRAIARTVAGGIARGETGASATRLRELATLAEHVAGELEAGVAPLAAFAPSAPDVDEALRISLRQQLFGRRVLVSGHAGAGLVRIALIQLLALAGARVDAGARALTAADLSRGHVLAARGLEADLLLDALVEHDPQWRVILDGVAAAARVFSGAAATATSQ